MAPPRNKELGMPKKAIGGQRKLADCCCFCGENLFHKLFVAPGADADSGQFELVECQNCHVVRTEPLLDDDRLSEFYAQSYYGSREGKFTLFIEMLTHYFSYFRAKSLLARVRARQNFDRSPYLRVLDVGCGRATLLKILDQLGCECYGVERENFQIPDGSQHISLYRQPLETIHFERGLFDAVVMWHALEHMRDPAATLREIARILRTGGLLVLAVPNFDSFQRWLFGARWFHLDLPRHTHHFGVQTLLNSLRENGFRVLSRTTFCLEQNPYGFIQSCLNTLVPRAPPNALYSLLKDPQDAAPKPSAIAWIGLALFISPLALAEYLASGMFGVGATIAMCAEGP